MSSFGRGFFGEATARLGRLLGLEGDIPIELGKTLQPVVVVGDATSPGNNPRQGKAFTGLLNVVGASNQAWLSVPGGPGVVIERLTLVTSVTGQVALLFWDVSSAVSGGAAAGNVVDSQTADRPPLTQQAGLAGGTTLANFTSLLANTPLNIELGMYLSPGCAIGVSATNNTTGIIVGKLYG